MSLLLSFDSILSGEPDSTRPLERCPEAKSSQVPWGKWSWPIPICWSSMAWLGRCFWMLFGGPNVGGRPWQSGSNSQPTSEKKTLPRCVSLVNGYLLPFFAWETMILVLAIWPFDIDHRTNLFCLVPKVDGIGGPVGQVHDDAVTSNGSDQEPKCHGEQKASDIEDKGLLWTKCRPTLNHSNGTSSICKFRQKGIQTAMLHLCKCVQLLRLEAEHCPEQKWLKHDGMLRFFRAS